MTRSMKRGSRVLVALAIAVQIGCVEAVEHESVPQPLTHASCDLEGTGPAAARRLSQVEYARTVSALLGVDIEESQVLGDPRSHGFAVTTAAAVSPLAADRYLRAAEDAAAQAAHSSSACESASECLEWVLDDLGQIQVPVQPDP